MPFEIEYREHSTGNVSYILRESSGASAAEIWPTLGFNCMRWQTANNGNKTDWIYASERFIDEPAKNGIPILFPFPNRIRNGQFDWQGQSYQLPLNCPQQKHAIHGFACRSPWRITAQGADNSSAWLTGEFGASMDCLEKLHLWPSDYRVQITYRLKEDRLRIECRIENPDTKKIPFGLGFHPYFALRGREENWLISLPCDKYWRLEESIPDGKTVPVNQRNDLRNPTPIQNLFLDDIYSLPLTELPKTPTGLRLCGRLHDPSTGRELHILVSGEFHQAVAFIPPHRQAVCIEPYTCVTNALNLQQKGVDAGLLVLDPGQKWNATVEFSETVRNLPS